MHDSLLKTTLTSSTLFTSYWFTSLNYLELAKYIKKKKKKVVI